MQLVPPEQWPDPHPLYHQMRSEEPYLHVPELDEYVLTRHADCERVLRDPKFSSNPSHRRAPPLESGSLRERIAEEQPVNVLLFIDPPDHTRIRRLVSKAFTPRRVEELREHISGLVTEMLDEVGDEPFDVIARLAYPLPATVICELMGVPVEDRDRFAPWSSAASRLLDLNISREEEMAGSVAFLQLLNYFNQLFDERRAEPRDDLVSALLAAEEAGDRLGEEELRAITILLFVAGHETTMNLIGNGLYALLRHPGEMARLREDPSLLPGAIEELLRWDGPVHLTGRVATEEMVVGDITVEKGQQVVTLLAAANRDPAVFPDPDRLDVGRRDNHHLTFSHGIHYCLGAALARLEGQIAVGEVVRRLPGLELAEEPEYREHFVLRGLRSLQVAP